MPTKNSLEDIRFAESYVAFVARRGRTPEQRARANIVLSTMILLDRAHPTWRAELLAALNDSVEARDIADIFPIPTHHDDELLTKFLQAAMKGKPPNE